MLMSTINVWIYSILTNSRMPIVNRGVRFDASDALLSSNNHTWKNRSILKNKVQDRSLRSTKESAIRPGHDANNHNELQETNFKNISSLDVDKRVSSEESTRPSAGIIRPFPQLKLRSESSEPKRNKLSPNHRHNKGFTEQKQIYLSRNVNDRTVYETLNPEHASIYNNKKAGAELSPEVLLQNRQHLSVNYNATGPMVGKEKNLLADVIDSGDSSCMISDQMPEHKSDDQRLSKNSCLPQVNKQLTYNYNNLYQESFLPNLYTKYKPSCQKEETQTSVAVDKNEEWYFYRKQRPTEPSIASRHLSCSFRLGDDEEQAHLKPRQNCSVIQHKVLTQEAEQSSVGRHYNQKFQHQAHNDVDRLLVRKRIKPDLECFRKTQIMTKLQSHEPEINNREVRSISVPASQKKKITQGLEDDGKNEPIPTRSQLYDNSHLSKLKPRLIPRAEFRRTFLSQNPRIPYLQSVTRSELPSIPQPPKSKYGAFGPGESDCYKSQKEPQRVNSTRRYWAELEKPSNLYYPISEPYSHHSAHHSPVLTPTSSYQNRPNQQPFSVDQMLLQRRNDNQLQYIKKVSRNDEQALDSLSPTRLIKERKVLDHKIRPDYNILITNVYKDKKIADMLV